MAPTLQALKVILNSHLNNSGTRTAVLTTAHAQKALPTIRVPDLRLGTTDPVVLCGETERTRHLSLGRMEAKAPAASRLPATEVLNRPSGKSLQAGVICHTQITELTDLVVLVIIRLIIA